MPPWKALSTRLIYENPWLRLREDQVIRPDGNPGIYGVVELNPSVAVVAMDDNGRIPLVRQWRYVHSKYSVELPSGSIHEGEDILDAAKRELKEEAGITAAQWKFLGTADSSNGCTTDIAHLYLATGLTIGESSLDPTEADITMQWVDFEEAVGMAVRSEITETSSMIAILKLAWMRCEGK